MNSIIDPSRLERIEFSNDEIARYSRHLIMPEVTLEGQKRLKAASVLCIGTGGLGSPIALYLAAAGVGRARAGGRGHRRFLESPAPDSARHEGCGAQEAELRPRPHPRDQSQRAGGPARHFFPRGERPGDRGAVRHRDRRHGQFPHALLFKRCMRIFEEAEHLRLDLPVRRAVHGLRAAPGRLLLPLHDPRAAAAGPGAELRGGRRAGRAAGHHRRDAGHRGDQAHHRHRRAAHREAGELSTR